MRRVILIAILITVLTTSLFTILTLGTSQPLAYIQITSDGRILPSSAPIYRNGNIYTLSTNFNGSISVARDNAIVDGANNQIYGISFWGVEDAILENMKIMGSVLINTCLNVTVRNCTIASENEGITVANSVYTTIYHSNISTNGDPALVISNSQVNNITHNTISAKNNVAIRLNYNARGNAISHNHISNSVYGIRMGDAYNPSVSGCIITDNRLINNYFGIWIFESGGNKITRNTINGSHMGIRIFSVADGNEISENDISHNDYGILLKYPKSTRVYRNNITQNKCGVNINASHRTEYNQFVHNNFINNTDHIQLAPGTSNTWNSPYPSGGNYWDNYTGTDTYSGHLQDLPGLDHFGDSSYILDGTNVDNFPLMQPFKIPNQLSLRGISPRKTVVGQNFSVPIEVNIQNFLEATEITELILYANAEPIYSSNPFTLPADSSTQLNVSWNTTLVEIGEYLISGEVAAGHSEVFLADNHYVFGWITVTIPGDVEGDFDVDICDIVTVGAYYGTSLGDLSYNFNFDINGDAVIDIFDLTLTVGNYGKRRIH